jgi:phenylacetic acid degradation operon negative regulatory protein
MQARSALFDLYGDHLRVRGGRAPVAALVRLLSPIGIAAPAVRTAISRMVRQGWLTPVRSNGGAGYQLTVRAVHRLDEAAARIYRTGRSEEWSGRFDLVLLCPAGRNPLRRTAGWARVTGTLSYLGYGSLDQHAWVAPRAADEVDALLHEAGIPYERFDATHAAGADATSLVRRAWDLDSLAAAYQQFLADQRPSMRLSGDEPDEVAYAARFRLVHAWRSFLFQDPQLPASLLPTPWPGDTAAAFFDHHEARLRPAADRFVDACLAGED